MASLYPLPNCPSERPNDLNNYFAQGPGRTDNVATQSQSTAKQDLRYYGGNSD